MSFRSFRLVVAASNPPASPRSAHPGLAGRCTLLALAGLASAGALAAPPAEFYAYRIDAALGPSFVNAIASNDVMTGEDASNHGFVMRRRKPALPIPLPPGFLNVLGYSINKVGQVTGVGELLVNGRIRVHAFYADWQTGEAVDIPPLAGRQSQGFAINTSGQIAGDTDGGGHFFNHAFITDAKGSHMRDLGTLGGPTNFSTAAAIDSRGEVAGSSTNAAGAIHAFLSGPDGGALADLGVPPEGVQSNALGMNEQGIVVGTWSKADGFLRGFVTGQDGASMRDLGQFDGQPTTPLGVNAGGHVVGWAALDAGNAAFITDDRGSGFIDLNTVTHGLGTRLISAVAINDLDHVIAWGRDGFSYLLCPTPHCK
jgi:hypothetical protein